MSDRSANQGHWETHSYASAATKIGDNPPRVVGKEASAQGTFEQGTPVVTDSHATSFTNQGHPDRIEYKDESGNQQRSIQ
ncbi:unnamed protein product [Rotaria sp. Silwood2]|nr:unnamed protein product [Rotaria sp. Silwood2]CAF3434585.1 unnamed protein product [Rotaria sp. Silwood2]CAF4250222.1 unnamed protein product [Rotaria sp. Silwood2]CAF4262427.1 unnamed protein product [Rotaria sp. Silwood2]